MPGGEDNVADYLTAAAAFANDKCWGNLATLIYGPQTVLDANKDAI